jgi:bacteriocin-like protein
MIQELNNTELQEINGGSQASYDAGHNMRILFDNLLLVALLF